MQGMQRARIAKRQTLKLIRLGDHRVGKFFHLWHVKSTSLRPVRLNDFSVLEASKNWLPKNNCMVAHCCAAINTCLTCITTSPPLSLLRLHSLLFISANFFICFILFCAICMQTHLFVWLFLFFSSSAHGAINQSARNVQRGAICCMTTHSQRTDPTKC